MHRQCSGGWMNNARGCGRNSPTCFRRWCVERCFSLRFMSSLDLMKYCSCIWTGLLWAQHCWKCINVSHSHPWALQDYWGQDACESAGLGLSKVNKWFKEDDSQYKLVWLNYYFFPDLDHLWLVTLCLQFQMLPTSLNLCIHFLQGPGATILASFPNIHISTCCRQHWTNQLTPNKEMFTRYIIRPLCLL